MLKFLAGLLLVAPAVAHAACDAQLTAWAAALQPGRTLDQEQAACKVWPADEAVTLAVLPFAQQPGKDGETVYDLEVLTADSATGKVLAHLNRKAVITSDAIQFSSLTLDTARYQLSPGVRAFGVRIGYRGSSRVDPYESDVLSLYVIDGTRIRPVLDNLVMTKGSGEWDGNCAGDFSNTTRTMSVAPARSSGYALLKISETTQQEHAKMNGNDCDRSDVEKAHTNFTLDYNGTRYGVPSGLSY